MGCSLRQCPRGDDPETECNTDRGEDIQRLTCKFATGVKKAFFQLRFTDQNANSIQDALEALPNFAIPQVEVDFDDTSKTDPKIDVKFTDGHNTGKQQILMYKATAPCTSGSQPLFRTTAAAGDLTCTVKRTALPDGANYRESSTCSNRGICDQSTGRCNCFDGFFGLACDHVNTYI